ncbi:MAG: NAD(P)/FAD-dependent oxidoreductase [Elusimicrobiota bacterium]|nr:NAD(P)/FAD-dependent oxidoreductase [Elusimicrobiota bacterium]
MEKIDILIIGAGVVGLAATRALSASERTVFVIDKNISFGMETSSRNSEVIHSGLYYPTGSLKHEFCLQGNTELYMLARKSGINFRQTGKFVAAETDEEIRDIHRLYVNGRKNGVEGLKILSSSMVAEYEPRISCREALLVPSTGIIDTHQLMEYFIKDAASRGAEIVYSAELTALDKKGAGGFVAEIKEPSGEILEIEAGVIVNAAGLNSDRVAAMAGIDIDEAGYRLKPCKGSYFRTGNFNSDPVEHLIYPAVGADAISLGIHLTPDLGGELRLGPDAEYVEPGTGYDVDERKKEKFMGSVNSFLSGLNPEEIRADTSGIRPKLRGPGEKFRDFIVQEESGRGLPGLINLIGIESPGLTAAIPIAQRVKELI